MSVFKYEKDADGIVTVTMDMSGPVNAMNEEYRAAMQETVDRLEQETGLTGVVIASAKKVFFAGGDLHDLLAVQPQDQDAFMAQNLSIKGDLRRLEKLPVPVVAAINGAALGGGFELCLACNHRIAWADRGVQLGLPEVTLGLLPGGGGVVRMVKLLGLEKALPYLLEGTRIDPARALEAGLVDALVEGPEQLVPAAKDWIRGQAGNSDAAIQPWDRKGYRLPGGDVKSPHIAQLITLSAPMLFKKTRGLLPAPEAILDCAVEAARLDLDTALRVEARGLTRLVVTPEAKNMISTFFFAMNRLNRGGSRPQDPPKSRVEKIAVLGAGMMGQGIAYAAAMAGIEVVLKDVSQEAAEQGKAYSQRLLDKRVDKGRMSAEQREAVLARIHPTAGTEGLADCELVVEAVFENLDLKQALTRELEPLLGDNAVWGSNTSSLPISRLAEASARPANFIGIHFFSPVDKMPLVEIICGEQTSEATRARAYDFARQIRKTPIVVNDSLGFFTSRTFGTYLDEGVRMLREGVHPVQIESAGKAVGMPVGPLAVYDEVSLELTRKAEETWREMGVLDQFSDNRLTREVVTRMVEEFGRGGRHHGGGFYEYAEDGSKHIWPRLFELYYQPGLDVDEQDLRERLLFRQVIEALRCLESGVLRSVDDGNIGSIMGIGAPTWTGGLIQFVNTYGVERFVKRCEALAAAYGERFAPPAIARDKAAAGEVFN